jgi:hypothetical protein
LLLVASLVSRSIAAQDWQERFIPEPDCVPGVALGSIPHPSGDSGALTVKVQRVGTHAPVGGLAIGLTPIDSQATPRIPQYATDTSSTKRFVDKRSGKYSVVVRRIGFDRGGTTATVRPGGDDTITIYLQFALDAYHNVHNCRPHGFRHPGEKACVTDSALVVRALAYARGFTADTAFNELRKFKLSGVPVRLTTLESACERAGRVYGGTSDLPRKVIVVQMGPLYIIYDPFEPLQLGEWEGWMIVDRAWKLIVLLAE